MTHTLYNAILRIARNFLETRENIKISNHPIVKSTQIISFIFTLIHYQSSGDVNEIDVTHRSKETNSSYKRNF